MNDPHSWRRLADSPCCPSPSSPSRTDSATAYCCPLRVVAEIDNRVGQIRQVGQLDVPRISGVADQTQETVHDVGFLLLTLPVAIVEPVVDQGRRGPAEAFVLGNTLPQGLGPHERLLGDCRRRRLLAMADGMHDPGLVRAVHALLQVLDEGQLHSYTPDPSGMT